MLARWNEIVNDFLGVPRTGWGDGLPTVQIVLVALALAWVAWVTVKLSDSKGV